MLCKSPTPLYLQTRSDLSSRVLVILLCDSLYAEQFMFSESANSVFYHEWYEGVHFYFGTVPKAGLWAQSIPGIAIRE